MSATTMYAGLAAAFATIPQIQNILLGEPTSIQECPAIYTAYAGFTRSITGQVLAMTHTFTHRLLLLWQDQAEAEAELLSLLHRIPIAIDTDPTLGGRISMGRAWVSDGTAGFVTINGTNYRIVDYTSMALEKGPYTSPAAGGYTGDL